MEFMVLLLLLTSSVLATNVVDEVNQFRRGFAASNGISDMWKLVETEEMIKIAKTFSTDCSLHKPGKNYRYFYFHGNDQAGKFEGSLIAFINQNEHTNIRLVNQFFGSYMRKTAFFMDFLEPTQKKIGCIPMNCKLTDVSKQFTPEYKTLCVLGDSQPSMPLPLPKSDKKPGTECGSKGHGEDGLCVENS